MHLVYLSIGSNQGNRMEYLSAACTRLESHQTMISARSPVYETAPWGFSAGTPFLNAVLEVETLLDPSALYRVMKSIEEEMGRIRDVSQSKSDGYESRCIDLDVLFYDDLILETPELTVPHPKLHLRNFVLVPMADLNRHLIHPVLKLTIHQLLEISEDSLGVQHFGVWKGMEAIREQPSPNHICS